MNYIPQQKIKTYLKLKGELALYVGIGSYFESTTFEWIHFYEGEPEDEGEVYVAKLVQSFDEGSTSTYYVDDFQTVEELEDEEGESDISFIESDFDNCIKWIVSEHNGDLNKFVTIDDLDSIYLKLAEQGELGHH